MKKNGSTYLTPDHPLINLKLSGAVGGQFLAIDPVTGSVTGVPAPSGTAAPTSATNCTTDGGGFNTCRDGKWIYNSLTGPAGAGDSETVDVLGSGYNFGNLGGWSTNWLHVENMTSHVRGITSGEYTTLNCLKAGDCFAKYIYVNYDGGLEAQSDESTGAYEANVKENNGYFHGSIPASLGVGFQNVNPTFVSGNNWTTDEAYFVNTSRDVITTSITGPSAPLPSSSLNYLPLSGASLSHTLTWGSVATTDGSLVVPHGTPASSPQPVALNFTINPINGVYTAFPSTGVVCVAGDDYVEQASIVSIGTMSSTHVQAITLNLRNPNGSLTIFYGGPCGRFFNFDVDFSSTGMRQLYPVLGSFTGSDLIYVNPYLGVTAGHILPVNSGGSLATAAGPNPIHIFHGAEVVGNRTDQASPILEPNTIDLELGDLVEVPHPATVGVKAMGLGVFQNTPCNPSQDCEVGYFSYAGNGINAGFTAQQFTNQQPYSYYTAGGGNWGAPVFTKINGSHSHYFLIGEAPQGAYTADIGSIFSVYTPAGYGEGANPNPPLKDWDLLNIQPFGGIPSNYFRYHPKTGVLDSYNFHAVTLTGDTVTSGNGFTGDIPAGSIIHVAGGIITGYDPGDGTTTGLGTSNAITPH